MAKRKRHLHREGRSGDHEKKPKEITHDVAAAVSTENEDPLLASFGIPIRDNSHLFAAPETINCARKCIPCAYKIGLFDVALDVDFCKQVPNQRPEQCHRLVQTMNGDKSAKRETQETNTHQNNTSLGYRPGMSVLCVGDGDFSFSLALARILFSRGSDAIGTPTMAPSRLIATSYETEETLQNVYPNFEETKKELHDLGATMIYQVDATKLAESLSVHPDVANLSSFDRICWNFPCSAIEKGQDGQNDEMEHNKDLIRTFVNSAMSFLNKNGGEIQICHKTKPPFNQWKLEEVVAEGSRSYINSSSLSSDVLLQYSGRIVLDRALLAPYIPRKALDRKSFPCHDACIYVFQQTTITTASTTTTTPPTTTTTRTSHAVVPPSTLGVSPTTPPGSMDDEATGGGGATSSPPQRLTNELILKLRARHLRLVKSKSKGGSSRYGRSSKRSKR